MSTTTPFSLNWLVLACSMVLTIIGAAPAAEPAPATSEAIGPDRFDRVANVLPVESAVTPTSVEDPPDEVKVAVVPRDGSGASASYGDSMSAAPVNYGPANYGPANYGPMNNSPVNLGPQAPFNGNYGNASTIPYNSNYAPAPTWNGGRPTAPYQPQPYQGQPNWNTNPYQQPGSYQQPAKPSDAELHDAKVTARYQDSAYLSFLGRSSMNQLTSLYMEASNLIDTRHVSPTSYQIRSQAAIQGLIVALSNPAFQQANGVAPRPDQIQAFQSDLSQIVNGQGPQTANEAVGIMQWVGETANRRLGLRREVVAMEFLNETLDSLDKYSTFMPNKTAAMADTAPTASLDVSLTKSAALEESIVGIGVELKTHEQGALVMGVIENGPSAQAGLRKGDILVSVNGQELAGQPLSQVADRITGPAGTQVVINVRRNGQRLGATLVRRAVYVSSVTGTTMIEGSQVGYIRLKQFSDSSTKDLEAAMMKLHNSGMQALVLDLRGNPGGLLTQAITVSDLFLTQGTIVSTKGRTAGDNSTETAKFAQTWNTPLVLLVDDNSASASEILAAAIQDNRRGVLVGRKSYGKGTVQTHFPLKTVNGTLKLTTAKFYAPSGREMAGQGVTPDYPVYQSNQETAMNLTEDADVRMALQVVQSGVAGQLAGGGSAAPTSGFGGLSQQLGGLRDYLMNPSR